jgi:16S rRNA (cytidine1402-2'-O)-methyltransferase
VDVLGAARPVVLAREVTKMHEEFLRGRADEVLEQLRRKGDVKGEITLMLGRASEVVDVLPEKKSIAARVRELQSAEQLDEKDALKRAAREFGVSKSEAYRELQRTK